MSVGGLWLFSHLYLATISKPCGMSHFHISEFPLKIGFMIQLKCGTNLWIIGIFLCFKVLAFYWYQFGLIQVCYLIYLQVCTFALFRQIQTKQWRAELVCSRFKIVGQNVDCLFSIQMASYSIRSKSYLKRLFSFAVAWSQIAVISSTRQDKDGEEILQVWAVWIFSLVCCQDTWPHFHKIAFLQLKYDTNL